MKENKKLYAPPPKKKGSGIRTVAIDMATRTSKCHYDYVHRQLLFNISRFFQAHISEFMIFSMHTKFFNEGHPLK